MRIFVVSILLLWQGLAAPALRAQCLALADLLAIGGEPKALTVPQVVTAHLPPEWVLNGPTATSREVFWTLPVPETGTLAAAFIQVRPQRPGQDAVLKTTQGNCVRELNRELKSRKLTAQPVTCPSCEAVRYQGPDFEVTIYSQMKGDYAFVVVVHQVPGAANPATPQPGSGTSAALSTVPAIEASAAAKMLIDPAVTILDVRTPEEYAVGHLLRAQNMNFQAPDFPQQISKLNPQGRYVLYCASGNRSAKAAALMQQQGIANIINAGGYDALRAVGAK